MRINKGAVVQVAVTLAVIGAFMYFSFRATTAGSQYGDPNDPYLDYQRQQRERQSLELQRRQVEILERQELYRILAPPRAHTQEVPACIEGCF